MADKNKDEQGTELVVQVGGINNKKLVTESPIGEETIDIPIIPPREHVEKEVTVKTVRVKKPVQIRAMSIRMSDGGGFVVNMPGGEVQFFGANQEVLVGSMPELLKLIARCLGQTTYEYVEMSEQEWEARQKEGDYY